MLNFAQCFLGESEKRNEKNETTGMVDCAGDGHAGWAGGGASRNADVERRRHDGGRLHGAGHVVVGKATVVILR